MSRIFDGATFRTAQIQLKTQKTSVNSNLFSTPKKDEPVERGGEVDLGIFVYLSPRI